MYVDIKMNEKKPLRASICRKKTMTLFQGIIKNKISFVRDNTLVCRSITISKVCYRFGSEGRIGESVKNLMPKESLISPWKEKHVDKTYNIQHYKRLKGSFTEKDSDPDDEYNRTYKHKKATKTIWSKNLFEKSNSNVPLCDFCTQC